MSRVERFEAKTLAVGYGFIPRTQLSQQMGLDHGFSDEGYLRANANQTLIQPCVYPFQKLL